VPGMRWHVERGILDMKAKVIAKTVCEAGLKDFAMRRLGLFPRFVANRGWGQRLARRFERIRLLEPVLAFQLFRFRQVMQTICRQLLPLSTQRRSFYFLLALAVWTIAALVIVQRRLPIGNDNDWVVRVAQRTSSGEVLYRDVFFGSTPLAIYLQHFV